MPKGLKISAVATSQRSANQAISLKIPMQDPMNICFLDITVDGADEIDQHKNMIKGGGGALLREKILARSSKEMIVIIDETKFVNRIGAHPVAIEIVPFVYRTTIKHLEDLGYRGTIRLNQNGEIFITDNGNYLFDIQYSQPILYPKEEQEKLKSITGVIETGLFFDLASRLMIGYKDGSVKLQA